MQPIRTTDSGSFLIETIVRYKDGTVIESCECPVIAKTSDAQALGSAITYARRYSLASILCIVTDDDDAESASDRPNNQRQPYERQAPAGQARHQQRTPAQQNVDAVSQPAEQVIAAVPVQASAPKIKKKELAELTKALTDWGNNVDVLMNDPGRRHNPEAYQIARTALIQFNGHMPVEDLRKYMQHLTDAAFENGIGYDGPTKKFYAAEPEMAEATNEELSQALADNE
ncbi:hypothetical protein FHK02_2221 [Spirosoma sp. LMG 31448]|nr:hypothetical protein [Spirosoma utsteinense]